MSSRLAIKEAVYSDNALRVVEAEGVIYNVRIIGRISQNGREYSDQALDDGARLYEGRDVFIDHAEPGTKHVERGLLESWGVIRNPTRKGDEVRGDLHYLRTHAATPPLVERAKRFPTTFGLSHDAEGTVTTKGGKTVVESLQRVASVDIVKKPATNRGLFEGVMPKTLKAMLTKLAENKANRAAPKLMKLLEDESSFAPAMADAPVDDTAAGGSPEEQMAAAIKSMVLAVLDDTALDASAKLAKIKAVLQTQDKITGSSEPTEEPVTKPDDPVAESLKQLKAMQRDNMVRDVLESHGLRKFQLTEAQRKLLAAQPDEDSVTALVESWPKQPTGTKPKIGSVLKESRADASNDSLSYEELRKQIRPKSRAS